MENSCRTLRREERLLQKRLECWDSRCGADEKLAWRSNWKSSTPLFYQFLLYGATAWALTKTEEKRLDTLETGMLRSIVEVRWDDFVRNIDIREMIGSDTLREWTRRGRWSKSCRQRCKEGVQQEDRKPDGEMCCDETWRRLVWASKTLPWKPWTVTVGGGSCWPHATTMPREAKSSKSSQVYVR